MNRILHITGAMNRAGAETLIMNLYRNLDRENYQFDFLYFTNNECDYDKEIKILGGNIYRIPNKKSSRILNIAYRHYRFYLLLKKLPKHNTIHSHINLNGAFFLFIAYLLGRKKRVAHSHSSNRPSSKIMQLKHLVSTFIIHHFANIYITCGDRAADYLFPRIDPNKIIKFPNCIELKYFDKKLYQENFIREKYNLEPDITLIVQVGSLTPVKNHLFSLNIVKHLREKNRKVHLILVGSGELSHLLREKVIELNIFKCVSFLGTSDNVPEIMYSSDVLLMPSFIEGFPMVLVEAQACGLPCCISDTISKEVDLDLGLVTFIPLKEKLNIWEEKIFAMANKKSPDLEEITKVLKLNNFDSVSSVKNLESIYSN